jgi:hypothetical protein
MICMPLPRVFTVIGISYCGVGLAAAGADLAGAVVVPRSCAETDPSSDNINKRARKCLFTNWLRMIAILIEGNTPEVNLWNETI